MESLIKKSKNKINDISLDFVRYIHHDINWDWRLIGIKGARGVGKTTLLLQHLKSKFGINDDAIYISLDDIYFTAHGLYDFASDFIQIGGKSLYIDEVHKYPNWAREIKNLYDDFPKLNIIFTGSSIIELNKLEVDLSRRAVVYDMNGLSFREYLILKHVQNIGSISLDDVLINHLNITYELLKNDFKPLYHFKNYIKHGYFPYFVENEEVYHQRLEQSVRLTLETDLSFMKGFDPKKTRQIYQLLYILATNVPFKPNITRLSERIQITRNTLVQYLYYLEKAKLLKLLQSPNKGISMLQKPDKVYLDNTNLAYAISPTNINVGNMRETFFQNQLSVMHEVHYSKTTDFLVNQKYNFEVGGKNKQFGQIKKLDNAHVAADEIETGYKNKIPLWLFGYLY